jgi:hypothetical protein
MLAGIVPAFAQTNGMDRRDNRGDDRSGSRAAKQACKAGDEKSRADCRQMKREVKRTGLPSDGGSNAAAAPVPKPAQ